MKRVTELLTGTRYSDCAVRCIKNGYSSDIYELENESGKYIAHIGKAIKDSGSSFLNSFRTLKYLESVGISFVPRALLFLEKEDFLIETFVGKEHVSFVDLDEKHLDIFTRQLVEIHRLDYRDMQKFCEREGLPIPEVLTPLHNIKLYGFDRFEIVQQHCPDKDTVDWIRPKLEENKAILEKYTENRTPGLRWGDIGNNTRMEEGNIFFIDWEFASITYGHELSYIKIHSHPSEKQLKLLVEKYSEHSKIPEEELYREIEIGEKVTRVNDVIWAAMKWGQNKADEVESEKYKKLTKERIKLYEKI